MIVESDAPDAMMASGIFVSTKFKGVKTMNEILTVAFIVAVTAFIKTQFNWDGRWALLVAFLVALVIGVVPLISAALLAIGPWLEVVVRVFVLFLGAAGSYDAVMTFRRSG